MQSYFNDIQHIRFEGVNSQNPLAFHHYDANENVLGKSMAEHLRFAACYWHNFCWNGADMFGAGSFDRPWQHTGDPLAQAKMKADIAFEFFDKLNVPFYCFHDMDVIPASETLKEYVYHMQIMMDILAKKQQQTGVQLLWGTANCFSHPRYGAGAATSPNPDIFAWAATQVFHAMNATHQLGGHNYVLWGGREGYESLLNTDLRQERLQLGRFMQMVVEHKHKIGFTGTLLIEPKPHEPTKHQYDYDVATVYGFLKQFGLEKEIKVNIEANHATLAGHAFHHEIAQAIALDILGSIDANRGDAQLGWDTDQFPNSVEENTLVMYEILKAGGLQTGGFNFDAKVRRQSTDKYDLFYGHIGAMDTLALALKAAAKMVESHEFTQYVDQRYAGWKQPFAQHILDGQSNLADVASYAEKHALCPSHVSGEQEKLENRVNRYIFG